VPAPSSVRSGLVDLLNAAWDAHAAGQDYNQSLRVIVGPLNIKILISWPAGEASPAVRVVLRPV
jgi:hypothetical protein